MSPPHLSDPVPRPALSTDLFDQQREDWRRDPQIAFDACLARQHFRRSSVEVYQAQWGLFLEWLSVRQKSLVTVDAHAIAEFVADLDVKKTQRMRYLRLIERV